jgi:hypothetical protein
MCWSMFLNFKLKIFQGFLAQLVEHLAYNRKLSVQTRCYNKDNTFLCLNLILLFKPSFLVYQGLLILFFVLNFLFGTVFRSFENASKLLASFKKKNGDNV